MLYNSDNKADYYVTSDTGSNPVDTLIEVQREYKSNDTSHKEKIVLLIDKAVGAYKRINQNDRNVDQFYRLPFWDERKYELNDESLLLHCMQFMVGAPHSQHKKYRTASDYAAAVEILLGEGLAAEDLFGELKSRGGPYGVLRESRMQRRRKSDQVDDSEPQHAREDDLEDQDNGEVEGGARTGPRNDRQVAPTDDKAPAGNTERKPRDPSDAKRVRIFDPAKHFAIGGDEFQERCREMTVRERQWVLIERLPDEEGILRFDVVKIQH